MTDDELAARCDHNFRETMAQLAQAVSGDPPVREEGLLLASCRSPVGYFNSAFVTGARATDDVLRRVESFFGAQGLPFVVRGREGLTPDLAAAADAFGLVRGNDQPVMALAPLVASPGDWPAGFDLRPVTDSAGLDDHINVIAPAFAMPVEIARGLFSARVIGMAGTTVFVGYLHGEPVCTSLVSVTGDTAGVYNVATLPEYRRRGLGEAATWGALRSVTDAGVSIATLQASDMGRPIYERMGFRIISWYQQHLPQ